MTFLKESLQKLLQQRNKRIKPQLDDKILLGWNALMNIALSKASASFGNVSYKELAITNFDFLWLKFVEANGGLLSHTYKNGIAKHPAFLDDYAYLVKACIQLQEITSNQDYLHKALLLTRTVVENFGENVQAHFYYTGKSQSDVIVRKKEIYDGAVPSGNSVMAANLLYLSIISDNREWKEKAINMITGLTEIIIKYPTSFANWACVFIDEIAAINEIAIVGKGFEDLRDELLKAFMPNKVLQCVEKTQNEAFPLLLNKTVLKQPLIYLCRNYTCLSPIAEVRMAIDQIITSTIFNRSYNN